MTAAGRDRDILFAVDAVGDPGVSDRPLKPANDVLQMSRINVGLRSLFKSTLVPAVTIAEKKVNQMQIEKIVLEKSAETLLEKAADCFDLADTQQALADKQHEIAAIQHENADQQHELAAKQHVSANKLEANADKLDAMGHALEASAVEIKGDTVVVQRGR